MQYEPIRADEVMVMHQCIDAFSFDCETKMTFIGSANFEEADDLLLNSVGTVVQFRAYLKHKK